MKHRRQNVLASVLLHVIEAPLPINNSLHRSNLYRPIDNVDYLIFFVDHIHDTRTSKVPDVVGLAAGGGIKGGAIESHSPQRRGSQFSGAARLAAQEAGGKFLRKRVIVIESFSRHPLFRMVFLLGVLRSSLNSDVRVRGNREVLQILAQAKLAAV
jgi:hypothetical protein